LDTSSKPPPLTPQWRQDDENMTFKHSFSKVYTTWFTAPLKDTYVIEISSIISFSILTHKNRELHNCNYVGNAEF
jgi:hypothetical protein